MATIQELDLLRSRFSADRSLLARLEERVTMLEVHHQLSMVDTTISTESFAPDAAPLFVTYDFETTGLGKNCQIVQMAAAVCASTDSPNFASFKSDVQPSIAIDASAQKVHGITSERLADAEPWGVVGHCFAAWLESLRPAGCGQPIVLLAHNGKRFDARVLVTECRRCGITLPENLNHIDTIDIFKRVFPKVPGEKRKYNMAALHTQIFNRPIPNAHDAIGDVVALNAMLSMVEWKPFAEELSESFVTIQSRTP